jgi:FMN-dependent NADH-azoreductase
MANILHIAASPRDESYSTRLASVFFETYRQARPEDRIETLHVFRTDIPSFCAPTAKRGQVRRGTGTGVSERG